METSCWVFTQWKGLGSSVGPLLWYKALTPTLRAPLLWLNQPWRPHLLIPLPWRLGSQHTDLGGTPTPRPKPHYLKSLHLPLNIPHERSGYISSFLISNTALLKLYPPWGVQCFSNVCIYLKYMYFKMCFLRYCDRLSLSLTQFFRLSLDLLKRGY